MRSVEIIGFCGIRLRGRVLLYAGELIVNEALVQGRIYRASPAPRAIGLIAGNPFQHWIQIRARQKGTEMLLSARAL
jgi:hypothetical protein